MHCSFAILGLAAAAVIALPSGGNARPDVDPFIAQAVQDTELTYAKWKGWKGKKVKYGGPPPWAPAHGYRRKRGW
jgi:hypothetical protein